MMNYSMWNMINSAILLCVCVYMCVIETCVVMRDYVRILVHDNV